MDEIKFIAPATLVLSGQSSSGKSTFTRKLINTDMFDKTPVKIYYCYGAWQKHFDDMNNVEFIQGLPQNFSPMFDNNHNLLIIDDLQDEVVANKAIENLFTRESHHKNLSVAYINQNLFYQGKHSRTIALNTHYTILFRNPRATSQLRTLASQTGLRYLEAAYVDAMENDKFGYLVIDLSPFSNPLYKVRTRIFPGQDTIIYNS